jgi:hypothetical protein
LSLIFFESIRYREVLKLQASPGAKSFGDDKAIATALYIQSSCRRVLAKLELEIKIAENSRRDKAFTEFCCRMEEGLSVVMYSRKYGTSPTRVISFDKDFSNLTFSTSFGTRGKVDLKTIFKIHSGVSRTLYMHSKEPTLSRCICLECLGERVVDLELDSAKDARDIAVGFRRLAILLNGKTAPFYLDNFGIPRRVGPSIIQVINEK